MKSDHDGVVAVVEQSTTRGIVSLQPIKRRSMLRSVSENSVTLLPADDQALIALGERFGALVLQEAKARSTANKIIQRSQNAARRRSPGVKHPVSDVLRSEELRIPDFDQICQLADDLSDQLGRLIDQIWAIRPITLGGVEVYAMVAKYWFRGNYEESDPYGAEVISNLVQAILGDDRPARRRNTQSHQTQHVMAWSRNPTFAHE